MTEYKVKNKLTPPRLSDTRMGGYLGRLADRFFDERLRSDFAYDTIFAEAEEAFTNPRDDETGAGFWRGEFWGKMAVSAARVCRYTGDEKLKEFLHGSCRRLLACQREDGYLGSYVNADFVTSADPEATIKTVGWPCTWCWNIWCRKYTLWGMLECYELIGDTALLDGCRGMADFLIEQLDRLELTLAETGAHAGFPSVSIIKPMLILYRHTGDERYLKLCLDTAADLEREDGREPNLIANARTGKPVHTWYGDGDHWGKAYELMSCLDGLCELYRVTGEPKYLDTCRAMFDNLMTNELNAFYSVGFNDVFAGAAYQINSISEPCDTVHWLRLCHELFTLTGESGYMDAFELAALNPMPGAVFSDGKWGSRALRSQGMHMIAFQMDYSHNHCCVNNLPRGLLNIADSAVMHTGDALYINLYNESETKIDCSGGTDTVRISEGYTRNCRVKIRIDHDSDIPEEVFVRIPEWSENTRIAVSGREYTRVYKPEPGGYLSLGAISRGETTVSARFDGSPRLIPFAHPVKELDEKEWKTVRWCSISKDPRVPTSLYPDSLISEPRCTLRMGPILLARSLKNGNTPEEMFESGSVFGKKCEVTLREITGESPSPDAFCRYEVTLKTDEGETKTVMCDFASCGNHITGDRHDHSIWL